MHTRAPGYYALAQVTSRRLEPAGRTSEGRGEGRTDEDRSAAGWRAGRSGGEPGDRGAAGRELDHRRRRVAHRWHDLGPAVLVPRHRGPDARRHCELCDVREA